MDHVKKLRGFTLIELMLAMAFISVLLLAVALTVIQISQVYNRGLTLKEVNQVSRTIADDLTRTVASSQSFSLDAGAGRYVSKTWGGRLCLGQYSYIWNYGTALNANDASLFKYTTSSAGTIKFIKVPDLGAAYCKATSGIYPDISPTSTTELLQLTDHDLAIHKFDITTNATSTDSRTGQQLYTINFTIGTNDTNALDSLATGCKPPSDSGADLQYCSVQQFTIVVRTQNAVN